MAYLIIDVDGLALLLMHSDMPFSFYAIISFAVLSGWSWRGIVRIAHCLIMSIYNIISPAFLCSGD